MRILIIPLSRTMSVRAFTARWRSAIIAVFVTRGSTTITVAAVFPMTRGANNGWLSAMLAPTSRMQSATSRSE